MTTSIVLLIWVVPILYGLIYALEFTAILSRQAGLITGKNITAYSIQTAVYMGTRFALLLLLPLLGYFIDIDIAKSRFISMVHFSFLFAAVAGVTVFALRQRIVSYYVCVINEYDQGGSFVKSLLRNVFRQKEKRAYPQLSRHSISGNARVRLVFMQSVLVFTVYAIGIFLAFYGALSFPEFKTTISQVSGFINAFGAVLLTFFVEPKISRTIDANDPDAPDMIMALFLGRLAAVAITAHVAMLAIYGVMP
jgi:hypothetical protein